MGALPPIERVLSLGLRLGARHLDERHPRDAAAGPVAGAGRALTRAEPVGEGEQPVERADRVVDTVVGVAALGEPAQNGRHRELLREACADLLPVERRGDASVGQRPDGVCGRHRPVLGILVEVDEDALATLLLPPTRGGEAGCAVLDLPGERLGG